MHTLRQIALSAVAVVWCSAVSAQTDSVAMRLSVDDVTVTAVQQTVSTPDRNGNTTLSTRLAHNLPRLGGAVDIVKMLQYTPGVTATADGEQGIFVRGSDAGQSRLMLNGAPIYAPSHMLGFFSMFNSAYLGGVTLLKNNIPAHYGSMLSSVVDVRTHMSIPARTTIEGNIGLVESDVATQVRLSPRASLFGSARHSYASWLSQKLLVRKESSVIDYEFGDYAVGGVFDLGRVGNLVVNSHFGNDRADALFGQFASGGGFSLNNSASSAQLQTRIGSRVSMENTIYATLYGGDLDMSMFGNTIKVVSGISDYGVRNVTSAQWNTFAISGGGEYAYRVVSPQRVNSSLAPSNSVKDSPVDRVHEAALYASAQWTPHRHFELDAGVRMSLFASDRVWLKPEPRVMIGVPVSRECRLWAVYNRSVQYLHYIPQSNTGIATDFIVASTRDIPPQSAHNFSVGYRQSAAGGRLNWTLEGFYRRMSGVVECVTNISSMATNPQSVTNNIYSGVGEAYGLEAGVGYVGHGIDLQLNYTLSRSLRQFATLNGGCAFPSRTDRIHNLSMMALYTPSARWSIGATFVYASGAPYTTPTAIYMNGGMMLKEVGAYNGARLPDLHRLDLSVTYWIPIRGAERLGLNVSVYNVYARRNPLLISWVVEYDKQDSNLITVRERRSALYSIVPSASLTFKF